MIARGRKHGELYVLEDYKVFALVAAAKARISGKKVSAFLWHHRLGHANLSTGADQLLPFLDEKSHFLCTSCQQGKHVEQSFMENNNNKIRVQPLLLPSLAIDTM